MIAAWLKVKCVMNAWLSIWRRNWHTYWISSKYGVDVDMDGSKLDAPVADGSKIA